MPEVDVISEILCCVVIEWMQCHLQCRGCHKYAECGVINKECCDVILSGYYVLNIGDMMSQISWM